MYNFALAFVICGVVYFIGEAVSNLTKAWIPSVFVTAAVLLVGFWTVIPTTVVSDSMLIPFGSTIGIYLLITHMGTVISIKQLLSQWKTIVVCLAGLAGMCALCLIVLPGVIGRDLVVAGLPPLTGGIIAATTMKAAAEANGLAEAAIFAIAMYCVQGFAGYPLTALCLQLEGKKLLKKFRSGEVKTSDAAEVNAVEKANELEAGTANKAKKKLIPELPEKWNGPVMIFLKLGIVAWLATMLGTIAFPGIGKISGANGELVTMTFTYPEVTTIDTFYTTADGYLITPQTLEYGTGYSIVEVQAPYGYVLNSEPVYFDVTQDGSAEESGITVIEVVRSNMAQKGTITVSKSGEVFTSVSENNGMYQPVFAVQGLEGAVYEITAAEDIYTLDGTLRASKGEVVDTITTGTDGIAKSKELYLGKYEVKEITAPYGMVLNDEIHAVELVYAGQNIAVSETETSFYNERQRVEIDLVKSLETDEAYGVGNNGEIFDVTFGLYAETDLTAADGTVIPADGLIEIISLDENGKGTVNSDLPFGSYYVKELSTNSAYVLNEQKYPVHFEYAGQDTAIVHLSANDGEAIENEIIYGSVSGLKSDEDGNALGGAVIGIFKTGTEEFTKENAIQTTTSADDGSFSFEKVPYGTWVIREIESPTGFVLSEEEIAVTVGKVDEVVEIELVNYFIKGNIELTKVDADYPDNKLTGAVFEVYADTNGNGEFDKDDKLCGEMTELEGGVYQMTELRYGKYFVREKTAPDGFVLDDGVYGVSIEENGKTYTVENKAGVGFINDAQKGSLKIVKTSSDGKVEGFSFRVTSADGYDQTFKTDKNGEIFIEGLRIGEYTVSEVSDSASAGYILPADKQATVKTDSTTIVEMHNEFRDTPKTGDDFNLGLWVSLAAASVIGAGVLGFVGFKKKKKED